MRRSLHLFWNSVILILIGCLYFYYLLPSRLLLIAVYSGIGFSLLSDIDAGTKYHRHFLTHSVIWVIILWFLAWGYPDLQLIISFWVLGVGLHCLEDVRFNKLSMRGFYTIKTRQKVNGDIKGLTGRGSTVWLVMNFWCSVVIFGITVWGVA